MIDHCKRMEKFYYTFGLKMWQSMSSLHESNFRDHNSNEM